MPAQPRLEDRPEQPYLAISARVSMAEGFAATVDSGFPELFGRLAERGIARAGAPFIRYVVIDMEGELDIELGVPVPQPVEGDGRIVSGALPAGRYATLTHLGPYGQLMAANAALQEWAADQGIAWDREDTDRGEAWRARVEHYLTDPREEPDPSRWRTDVAYLVASAP